MMTCEPDSRPDSAQAQRIWVSILKDLSFVKRMWRLRNRDEVMVEKVVYDTSSLVHTGVQFSKKILGRM